MQVYLSWVKVLEYLCTSLQISRLFSVFASVVVKHFGTFCFARIFMVDKTKKKCFEKIKGSSKLLNFVV